MRNLAVATVLVGILAAAAPGTAGANLAAADLDGDGAITSADLKRLAEGLNTLAAAYRGDANGDGVVSVDDVRFVARVLVRAVAADRNLTDAEADAFAGLVAADGDAAKLPANLPPDQVERYRDLLRKLGVSPERRTPGSLAPIADALAPPGAPPAPGDPGASPADPGSPPSDPGPAAAEGGGGEGGVSLEEAGDDTLLPPPPGERPAFHPGLRKLADIFSQVLKDADINFNIREINEARNAALPPEAAEASFAEILGAFEGSPAEAIPVSDCPDPAAFRTGESGAGAGVDRFSIAAAAQASSGGRREFLPRSRFALRFNPADPEAVRIDTREREGRVTLRDEYEEAAPRAASPAPGYLDRDVRALSDDPWLSQFMRGLADATDFMKRADANGDGRVTRTETLRRLFSPEVARAVASGNASSVGLDPASVIVARYPEAVEHLTPTLVAEGVMSRGAIRRTKAEVAKFRPAAFGGLAGEEEIGGTVKGAANTVGYVNVGSTRLNVRTGPSTSNMIVGKLGDNAKVTILKRVGDWYKIEYPAIEQGYAYVHSDYIASRPNVAYGGYAGGSSGGGSSSGGSSYAGSPSPTAAAAPPATETEPAAPVSGKIAGAVKGAVSSIGAKIGAAAGSIAGAAVKKVSGAIKAVKKWTFF